MPKWREAVRRQAARTVITAVATVTAAAAVAAVAGATPAGAAGRTSRSGVVVTIKQPSKHSISSNFVGLTFEATTLGSAYLDPAQSNLPSFLAELGQGNLRFGGQTSEINAVWQPVPAPLPSWASFAVTPGDLATVGSLARATGWSTDLGVNLIHYDPAAAADEVQTAQSALGASLRQVEIGNEPDIYFYFLGSVTVPIVGVPTTYPAYLVNWNAYVAAIRAADPGVPIAGPDFFTTAWLPSVTGRAQKGLSEFTQHYYPYIDCGSTPVSADQLLSPDSFSAEDSSVLAAAAAARRAHAPLVLDEINSIACGSISPAAYQFASSLWAVHALLEAASDGVASVNVQMNPANCNSYTPLCVPDPSAPGTMEARPIFYSLQLMSSLEGGTLLKTRIGDADPLPTGVSEYAVRLQDGNVAVVVDNTTASDVNQLSLQLDATAQVVSIQQLTAPSLDSSDGVSLTSSTPASGSTSGLTVPADSAEVFTLAP